MQTLQLHYLKGLLSPFCFSSKRYQIPFSGMQKGIRYRMQHREKSPKIKQDCIALHAVIKPFMQLAKGSPLEQLQKVIKYALKQLA
jgi:hypothetical protein